MLQRWAVVSATIILVCCAGGCCSFGDIRYRRLTQGHSVRPLDPNDPIWDAKAHPQAFSTLRAGTYIMYATTDCLVVVTVCTAATCDAAQNYKKVWQGGAAQTFPRGTCTKMSMDPDGSVRMYSGQNNDKLIWSINPNKISVSPTSFYLELFEDRVLRILQSIQGRYEPIWASDMYCCDLISENFSIELV